MLAYKDLSRERMVIVDVIRIVDKIWDIKLIVYFYVQFVLIFIFNKMRMIDSENNFNFTVYKKGSKIWIFTTFSDICYLIPLV